MKNIGCFVLFCFRQQDVKTGDDKIEIVLKRKNV